MRAVSAAAAHACRLGQGDGARRRRGGAGVVADEERERGARSRGASAKRVVTELLGSLLERGDVFGLLVAPAGVAVDRATRLEQREAGRRIVGRNERQGAAEVVERGRVDIAARRVLAGAAQVVDGIGDVAGALVVLGDQAEVLARAVAAAQDQPVGGEPMLLAARLLQHALVGDLVQDVVLEDELARALEGARLAAVGELAPRQAVERGDRRRGDALQRLVPEDVADHARLLQRRLLGRRQAVDARLQHAGERRRHANVEQLVGRDAPRLARR